ncbi:MAG: hypothetical protein IKQ60_08255 [Candidatus Methanomethylophilaceae archaeon]|nr:hypothetical protein [Candidatus Methanomethylophilaceae archaeon]
MVVLANLLITADFRRPIPGRQVQDEDIALNPRALDLLVLQGWNCLPLL